MRAVATITQGFRTDIKTGTGHDLVADEPPEQGGGNAGTTAMGLLASALAACTAATVRSYANIKGYQVTRIEVDVDIARRTPAEQKEAGDNARAVRASKKITIEGDITDEQRERMLQVALKCPVNRALTEGVDFL
ncbi:MAG: OsmC family protein [Planctomycetes bacterium]|nr:OsmC family protein [Planctomycetota bacterium]MCW8136319.1 OsmC family protein [Planctomycetota bacterium]